MNSEKNGSIIHRTLSTPGRSCINPAGNNYISPRVSLITSRNRTTIKYGFPIWGQINRCGTPTSTQFIDPNPLYKISGNLSIPVFHVVYSGVDDVTDAQISSQITALNNAFFTIKDISYENITNYGVIMHYLNMFMLINCLLLGCDNLVDNKDKISIANAGEDQTTYVGSYVALDPSKSKLEANEKIEIIEWLQDVNNPNELNLIAQSDLQYACISGFEKEGKYKFTLSITCKSGNKYTDDLLVTVLPRQMSLIDDINLEIRIRYTLRYKEGALTEDKLQLVDSLTTSGMSTKTKISSIKGLEYCNNITYLALRLQSISDLKPLSGLTKLNVIDLDQNYILKDISPIRNLTNLTELVLYSNDISDVSSFSVLTNLKKLDLKYTPISDISSLAGLTNLETLELDGPGTNTIFKNIEPLKNLTKLKWLTLPGRGISDITYLENLTDIELLDVNWNSITDISAISNMKKLVRLQMRRNLIDNITVLKNLENLDYLDAAENKIKDISALSYLSNIHLIGLGSNLIEDISPLVANSNLKGGVYLYLTDNPLNDNSVNNLLPILINRGVTIYR